MADWLVTGFLPTSLFSLRLPIATATASKSCLAPTPYALKLALVDAKIRAEGVASGKQLFDLLRGREVRIEVSQRIAVTNTLVRVAVPFESKGKGGEREASIAAAKGDDQYPFKPSVAFREFVHYGGPLRVAWAIDDLEPTGCAALQAAWSRLHWIGKRGSFVAALPASERVNELSHAFSFRLDRAPETFPSEVIVQSHDDLGAEAQFERVSTYSPNKIREGVDRVPLLVAFPLKVERRGRAFTSYVRTA